MIVILQQCWNNRNSCWKKKRSAFVSGIIWTPEYVPSSKTPSIKKHVCSELQKFVKWKERKILKVKNKKKLWHLIMVGTFLAEYDDVSVFNLTSLFHLCQICILNSILIIVWIFMAKIVFVRSQWPLTSKFILESSWTFVLPSTCSLDVAFTRMWRTNVQQQNRTELLWLSLVHSHKNWLLAHRY